MDRKDIIATLCKLEQMDRDAIQVYQDAIDKEQDGQVRQQLQQFQQDHRRHVDEIDDVIGQQGWTGVQPTREFESMMQGYRQLVDSADSDAGILFAMDLGEKATNAEYAEALQLDIDQQVARMLQRNFSDEQRHLSFIEANKPRAGTAGGGQSGMTGGGQAGASAGTAQSGSYRRSGQSAEGVGGDLQTATTGEGGVPYESPSGGSGAYGGMGGDVGPGGGGGPGAGYELDTRDITGGGDVTDDYASGSRKEGQRLQGGAEPAGRRRHPGEVPPAEERGGAIDADTRRGIAGKGNAFAGGGSGSDEGHPNMGGQVEGDSGNSGSGVAGSGTGD